MHFGVLLRISSYTDVCRLPHRIVHKAQPIHRGSAAGSVSCTPGGHFHTGDTPESPGLPCAWNRHLYKGQWNSRITGSNSLLSPMNERSLVSMAFTLGFGLDHPSGGTFPALWQAATNKEWMSADDQAPWRISNLHEASASPPVTIANLLFPCEILRAASSY